MNVLSRLLIIFRGLVLLGLFFWASCPALAANDHGNTRATATALTLGTTVNGNIEVGLDEDYFTVDLVAGQRYLFEMTPSGSSALGYLGLYLYGASSSNVAYNYGTTAIKYVYMPAISGTYYLKATGMNVNNTGTYSVKSFDLPGD